MGVILPLLMLTVMSHTLQIMVFANVPRAMPRPLRTSPVCLTELATFGCQFDIWADLTSTFFQRSHVRAVRPLAWSDASVATFWRRNWYGSMFAACASSSTNCSYAKHVCGAFGARSGAVLK